MFADLELGIDFGTSNTVTVLRRAGESVRTLLFDGMPLLPSAVYLGADGGLLTGRDALHEARREPARLEPNPKSRLGDGTVLLGGRDVDPVMLVAGVLGRAAAEASRVGGGMPRRLTLTHPAGWGSSRRGLLTRAATRAGLPPPRLVVEPVAAASYFTEVLGHHIPVGSAVVVYDFGAGTFDASVVIRGTEGFDTAVVDGLDVGGTDIDAAIVDWLSRRYGSRDPQQWDRLDNPRNVTDRRHREYLWSDARTCKELLSRSASASLTVPLVDIEAHLTRVELEEMARPLIEQTVRVTAGAMRHARTARAGERAAEAVAGVLLVGGSSRVPLVASMLHRELGIAPTIIEQPELVVAEGSLRVPGAAGSSGGTRILPVLAGVPPARYPVPAGVPAKTVRSRVPVATWTPGLPPVPAGGPGPYSGAAQGRRGPVALAAGPEPVTPASGWTRGPRMLLAAALAVGLVAIVSLVGLYLWRDHPGSSAAGTRHDRPEYVPDGWSTAVSSLTGTGGWHRDTRITGSSCTVDGGTLTVIRRSRSHGTGMFECAGPSTVYGDVALSTTMRITDGCAGIWVRTSDVNGYFLDACHDTVELHLLTNQDPSSRSRLGAWRATTSGVLKVGVLVRGQRLSVYIHDSMLGSVSDPTISRGRLSLGVFTSNGDTANVAFIGFRAWSPAA